MISAYRPLQIAELVDIACLSIDEDGTVENDPSAISEGELLRTCSNLIIKDQGGTCRFAHISVREYFSDQTLEFSSDLCHTEIATTCLGYLSQLEIRLNEILPNSVIDLEGSYDGANNQMQIYDTTLGVYSLLCWSFHWHTISPEKRRVGALGAIYYGIFLPTLLVPWIEGACFLRFTKEHIDFNALYDLYGDRLIDLDDGASRPTVPTNPLFAASVWDFEEVIEEQYIDMAALDNLNYHKYGPEHGMSAVELAYRHGNPGVLRKLLDKGATLVRRTFSEDYGTTPLMYPVEKIDMPTIRYLLARMTPQDLGLQLPRAYRTALHVAVLGGSENLELVRTLIQAMGPTKVVLRDHAGNTPLHYAAEFGNKNIVQLLLQNITATDVGIVNSERETALYEAVEKGHKDIVPLILNKMISTDIARQDIYGRTILHVACECQSHHEQIVPLLLSKMSLATVRLEDNAGRSAIDVAKENKNRDLLPLLEDFVKKEEDKIGLGLGTISIEAED